MRLAYDVPSRLSRLTFAVLLVVAWSGGVGPPVARADDAVRAPAAQPVAADPAQLAATVERLMDALELADQAAPRDRFDPDAIVAKVGRDPAALAKWVRDEVDWAPYRGILRGPVGVLMDRVGSGADRAVLLAELLRRAGHEVRLARAALDEAAARDVLTKVRPMSKERLVAASDLAADGEGTTTGWAVSPEEVAGRVGIDPTWLRGRADAAALAADRLADAAEGRAAAQAPSVLAAVAPVVGGRDGVAASQPAVDGDADRAAAADYWWVTFRSGETWADADPLLADGPPAAARAAAQSPVAAQAPPPPPAQPATAPLIRPVAPDLAPSDAYHEVVIRVVIEQVRGGRPQEHRILEQAVRPAEVIGQRIAVSNVPLDWPADLDPLQAADPAATLRNTAAAQRRWAPVLAVGDAVVMQSGFTTAGDVIPPADLKLFGATGGAAGGAAKRAADVFDMGPATPADPAAAAPTPGELTGQWVEFEVRAPGREPVTVRRQRVDLVGPAARRDGTLAARAELVDDHQRLDRALALLGETTLLLQPCHVPVAYAEHLAARAALANRAALAGVVELAVAAAGTGPGAKPERDRVARELSQSIDRFRPGPGPVYELAAARGAWSPVRGDVYLDVVNILAHHIVPGVDAGGATIVADGFDIVTNPVAVRPEARADAFRLRLAQGVGDTVAEAVLGGAQRAAAAASAATGDANGPITGENTSTLYARAAGGSAWVVVKPEDVGSVAALGLSPDVAARVSADVAAGYAVLAPSGDDARGTAAAWWRVDPRTGQTLGIGRLGWGADMAETAAIFRHIFRAANMLYCVGGSLTKVFDSAMAAATVALCVGAWAGGTVGQLQGGGTGTIISSVGDALSLTKNAVKAAGEK
jgi:hypothetical protein